MLYRKKSRLDYSQLVKIKATKSNISCTKFTLRRVESENYETLDVFPEILRKRIILRRGSAGWA